MLILPDRKSRLGAVFLAALVAALILLGGKPEGSEAGANTAVPSEAYQTVETSGSVELIVNLQNSAVINEALNSLRDLGQDAAADRLEQLFSGQLETLVQSLPAGVSVEERYEHLGGLLISVPTAEALDGLDDLPNVLSIGVPEVAEPLLTQSLALINQPEAFNSGYSGEGTSVAVLDTGVDYTHPAFGDCNVGGANCSVRYVDDFTDTPGVDGDEWVDNSRDDHGHGTNVSGIVLGVAPDTGILGLDVFRKDLTDDPEDSCYQSNCATDADLMAAIEWVVTNAGTYKTKALNMSLGGGLHSAQSCPTNLKPSLLSLIATGILPVVAAGNNGSTSLVSHPGCVLESYTVGAVWDADGSGVSCDSQRVEDRVTCFSNSSQTMVDSLAPGGLITAAEITMAGTSQATPHVAGAAAVLGAIEGVTVSEVENALKTTGPLITDNRDPANPVQKRRLDLEAAVAALGGGPAAEPITLNAAQTADEDDDGKIDGITLIFAENLNDDFTGLSVSVAGYNVLGFSTGNPGDAEVIAELQEGSSPDSGAEPLVTIVANSSLGTSSALVGPAGASLTATDEAGPAIDSAETTTAKIVVVHFSEEMKRRSVRKGDFKLVISGQERTIRRTSQVDANTWEIKVSRGSKWSSGSSGTVELVAVNVVKDSNRNKSKQTADVAVAAVY